MGKRPDHIRSVRIKTDGSPTAPASLRAPVPQVKLTEPSDQLSKSVDSAKSLGTAVRLCPALIGLCNSEPESAQRQH